MNEIHAFYPMEGQVHNTYILTTTTVLTLSLPMNADAILVQSLTQNVRYTLGGTNPTTSKGFQLKAGDPPVLIRLQNRMVLKFLAESSGAVLEYEYSGPK